MHRFKPQCVAQGLRGVKAVSDVKLFSQQIAPYSRKVCHSIEVVIPWSDRRTHDHILEVTIIRPDCAITFPWQ
eukprot:694204-Amphidinium_carterae.1